MSTGGLAVGGTRVPKPRRSLERELKIFRDHLEEWRADHMGEFVLIKGDQVIGFFGTLKEAFDKGTECFGLEPFFVHQIKPEDAVNVSFFGAHIQPL